MSKINTYLALSALLAITACTQSNQGLKPAAQTARVDNAVLNKHVTYSSSTEEYVNRVAKRVITVSDEPEINFQFKVIASPNAGIAFDQETNSILVSSQLLAQLQDEAQLAAVLNLGIAKYANIPNPDKSTINNLYRAGYDPNALVELQEQYVFHNPEHPNYWLGSLYSSPLSVSEITYNKDLVKSMPQGLIRDADSYKAGVSSQS